MLLALPLVEILTNRRLLVKNIGFSFGIQILGILLGLMTVPIIIKGLGIEQFGLLTIIWAMIGYSSLFDMSLGRALTQTISQKIATDHLQDIPRIIWTALILITFLGILVGVGFFIAAPFIVQLLKVHSIYRHEAIQSIDLLALSIPFLLGLSALKGILEAYQQFPKLAMLRLPILLCNYILPVFILMVTHHLSAVVLSLLMGRLLTYIGHFWVVAKTLPSFISAFSFSISDIKPLLKFGGWCTVSNTLMPMMTYLDRFFIAMMVSSQIIAFYSTPYDVINRMGIVSAAIMGVMFPALAQEYARSNIAQARRLYEKSILTIFLILVIPTSLGVFFAKPLIAHWISPYFAEHSFRLAQLLCMGFMVGGLNTVPYGMIQAIGRSDLTAKIHLVEFPLYLMALFYCVHGFGLIGAPIAFVLRAGIDAILLHSIALRMISVQETTNLPERIMPSAIGAE